MEEEMIRGLLATLVWIAFIFSLVSAALADGPTSSFVTDPENRSILSAWDRPAFEPAPPSNDVPWLSSRSATKGQKVDLLIDPKARILGPSMAQHGIPLGPFASSSSSAGGSN
jgi:hypothetical protein